MACGKAERPFDMCVHARIVTQTKSARMSCSSTASSGPSSLIAEAVPPIPDMVGGAKGDDDNSCPDDRFLTRSGLEHLQHR